MAEAPAAARVVVVDDEPTLRRTVARTLAQRGFEVTQCEDGAAALEHVRGNDPDVMLIDIGLPDVDGYQLASSLRALPDMAATVPVAVTGYGQAKDR